VLILVDNILEITINEEIIIRELNVFFSQVGKCFFMNLTLFIRDLIFLEINHNNIANTKGIRRLLPNVNVVTIEIDTIKK